MRRTKSRTHAVVLGTAMNLALAPVVHAWPILPVPEGPRAAAAGTMKPAAEAALRDGQAAMQSAKYTDAVSKLDLAIELEPNWSAPVRLRAEAFKALAGLHAPSEAFLKAQAADIELLLRLEPGVETAARHERLISLHREAVTAHKQETRRRALTKPSIVYIVLNASMLISGALMTSFYASTTPDALGQKNYVYTGIAMLAVGVAMVPGSIALGVLAGRQTRRDSALADFNVETGRRQRPVVGVSPTFLPGGAGVGFNMRF